MPAPLFPGPQYGELVRRLRAWSLSSWHYGQREPACRAAVQELADLAADAEHLPRRRVPDDGALALADQLAVTSGDALAAGAAIGTVTEVLDRLRVAMRTG